ncbi:MAG: YihY/virulence factor BrkB family protein [Chitinophagaceae bacterium]|nr:MAG: YihY/virulence factor BrkB family protein [Chitinophagaceae bacterium]
MRFFKNTWILLKETFTGFSNHKITKISGSLAYFTVFSMAPLLVVVISLCGIFLEREAVEGQVYAVLQKFIGADTAAQLEELVKNAALANNSGVAAIVGIITLLIGATTVFAEIQDSINSIWGLKPKPKRGWLKFLQNRFLSFSVIVGLGFLLLVSLLITGLIEGLSGSLQRSFPEVTVIVFYIFNMVLTIGISMLIFAVIYKVLPDAKIRWKDVWVGAFTTTVLFLLGKFAISFYISQTRVGSNYGAAGSLAVLLVWIYYSSIILYIGAEFTRAYAVKFGEPIRPNHYAVTTKEIEVETGSQPVAEISAGKEVIREKAKPIH